MAWQTRKIVFPKTKIPVCLQFSITYPKRQQPLANIPAYSREPRPLQINYDFLPDGYGDTLIMTETLNEVMADKLVSLVNTQHYVRHRNIWDLRWLKQQVAIIIPNWINKKINDYRIDDYLTKLDAMRQKLSEIIHGFAFRNERSRFIPVDVQERTLAKEKFYDFLVIETSGRLQQVKQALCGANKDDDFRI